MSNKVKFRAAHTATTEASVRDIWSILADDNNWEKWRHGIAHTEISSNFKVGKKFSLTLQGGEPIEITRKTATPREEFSDEACCRLALSEMCTA